MTDKARLLNHLEVFADTVCTPSQEMSRISARLLRMTPRTRAAARKATARAIKAGKLTRPPVCSKCGNATDVQAHHTDYERPLDVTWLCVPCHRAIHAGDRRGQGRPARPLPRGAITPQGLKDAEVAFQLAQESVEELRGRRNGMVLDALEEGWTHAQIADATGMSRGRVSQIAKISRHNA